MASDPKPSTDLVKTLDVQLMDALKSAGVSMVDFDTDPKAQAIATAEAILSATSLGAAFVNAEATSSQDAVDVPWSCERIEIKKSSIDDDRNLGVYVIAFGHRLDNGDPFVMTTGSAKVMAQLVYAATHNSLPIDVKVIEVGTKRPGQSAPLGLTLINEGAQV